MFIRMITIPLSMIPMPELKAGHPALSLRGNLSGCLLKCQCWHLLALGRRATFKFQLPFNSSLSVCHGALAVIQVTSKAGRGGPPGDSDSDSELESPAPGPARGHWHSVPGGPHTTP